MHYYQDHQVWFWTYLQNWPLIFRDDVNANALNHYWSLAIEEQYYLVWPLIVLLIKKPKGIIIFCLSMLVLVIAARVYIWNNAEDFPAYERAFLFTRIDGILIGYARSNMLHKLFLFTKNTAFENAYYCQLSVLFIEKSTARFPSLGNRGFTTFSFVFALAIYEAVMKENKFINFIFTNTALTFRKIFIWHLHFSLANNFLMNHFLATLCNHC
jgi:peptidoglycan/LPS O-acetylase OafA/YrhL